MTRKRAVKLLMSYGYSRNAATRVLDRKPRRVPNKVVAACGRLACCLSNVVTLSHAALAARCAMSRLAQAINEIKGGTGL